MGPRAENPFSAHVVRVLSCKSLGFRGPTAAPTNPPGPGGSGRECEPSGGADCHAQGRGCLCSDTAERRNGSAVLPPQPGAPIAPGRAGALELTSTPSELSLPFGPRGLAFRNA